MTRFTTRFARGTAIAAAAVALTAFAPTAAQAHGSSGITPATAGSSPALAESIPSSPALAGSIPPCTAHNANNDLGVGFWATYTIVSTAAWCSYSYKYELAMQGDGNLVLYNRESGSAIWATGTYNHPGATAKMQSDGNFVVYDTNGTALWSTGTWWAGADSHFVFQNDGNLVVYKGKGEGNPVWASGTYGA
ncbi:hypothetical protein ACFVVL_27535 [Kitasatospora sp. NPDC058115]|uniref:hypothetical protein n=1 Tax=Kitasatospora sp. NPDC058115 TaxID=3346347 RepID=UPI0036D93310